jgi:hypothetical protein
VGQVSVTHVPVSGFSAKQALPLDRRVSML